MSYQKAAQQLFRTSLILDPTSINHKLRFLNSNNMSNHHLDEGLPSCYHDVLV